MEHRESALIGRILEATVSERPWDRIVTGLNEHFHSTWTVLIDQNRKTGAARIEAAHNLNSDDRKAYEHYYGPRSPVFFAGIAIPVDRAYTERICPDYGLYLRSEVHNEYFKPRFGDHLLSVNLDLTSQDSTYIALRRSARAGEFGDMETRFLGRISPHLRRVLAMQKILGANRTETQALRIFARRMSSGVLFLDEEGGLLETDGFSDTLLVKQDGLYVNRGRVDARRADDKKQLRALIRDAVNLHRGIGGDIGEPFAIVRRSTGSPLSVVAVPLPRDYTLPSAKRPAVMLAVSDPEIRRRIDVPATARYFGLTMAEARLVSNLVARGSLSDAAKSLNITYSTARTYMKRILSKTGCKNQVDLVSSVLAALVTLIHPL